MNSLARKISWLLRALVAVTICALPSTVSAANYISPDFDEEPIVSGLTLPMTAAWAPDGRMFIAEKAGIVKVVVPGSSTATPILDITTEVYNRDDRGLLGLALDSDFESNGYMYLLYVHDTQPLLPDLERAAVSRLARVHVDNANNVTDMTVLLGTETDCVSATFPGVEYEAANDLDCLPAEGTSHAIGTVVAAPDGTLYVGNGDASSFAEYDPLSFRVYREDSFAGKILHVDRDGNGLSGHAFCPGDDDLTHVCTKLHAKAFRNPFRFKLRADDSLVVGDVGWSSREEIDVIRTAGNNYGWPCYEGTTQTTIYKDATPPGEPGTKLCQPEYDKEGTPNADVPPNYDYNHTGTNAIVAGPTYPGGPYPDAIDGSTFFGDYAAGFLKRVTFDGSDSNPVVQDVATDWLGVDLLLTPDNEIAYTDIGDFGPGTGSIKRIVYAPSAGAPKAVAKVSPAAAAKNVPFQFTGSGSTDPDGSTLSHHWDFGDGAESTQANPTHAYASKDDYTATLTVTDEHGQTDTDTVEVAVFDSPPTPTIDSPSAGATYRDGGTIELQGSATDTKPGDPALSWNVLLHHNGHVHQVATFDGPFAELDAPTDHDADCHFEIRLRATDADGEWRETTRILNPEAVPFSLQSTPAGAPVSYGGVTHTAPFSTQSAIGLKTSISAGGRFTSGSDVFHFSHWSDGGNRAHQVEIPASATTLTATYLEDKANGRAASASTVEGNPDNSSLVAGKAVDDDPETRWASEKGALAAPATDQWWQVDLGSARQVSRVELDWELAFATQYEVLTSPDGVSFTSAATETSNGAITRTTSFPSRFARYVRIQGVTRATNFGISFFEARVLGPPDGTPLPGTNPGPIPPPPDPKPPASPPDDPSYGEVILDTAGLLGYWPDGRDSVALPTRKIGKPAKASVELWLAASAKPRRTRVLATNARADLADGFTLALDAKHRPFFSVACTSKRRGVALGRPLKPGTVHHVVGTYDGKKVRLYVDGALKARHAYTGGIAYLRSRKLLLGRPARILRGGPTSFRGRLDEVAIYGRALSASTVKRHFRLGR